jgi:hypothetical protein
MEEDEFAEADLSTRMDCAEEFFKKYFIALEIIIKMKLK